MSPFQVKTPSQQLADHLRDQIYAGHYRDQMPGVFALAKDLGIDPKTASLAYDLLEKQKLLVTQGVGRPRKILRNKSKMVGFRIVILLYEETDRQLPYITDLVSQLTKHGYDVIFARKTLVEMKMKLSAVSRLVGATSATAWLVIAGSEEVLTWFAHQKVPVFALFGRSESLEMAAAGVVTSEAYREIVRRLVGMGHRRIVFLAREERRRPSPGIVEAAFLNELNQLGIQTGEYHLPQWEDHASGLVEKLDSLFAHTPPTALIMTQLEVYLGAQQYLLRRGIRSPEDVSMICSGYHSMLSWCRPKLTHLEWDEKPVIRRIVRWVHQAARGIDDKRQLFVHGKFVGDGTIGPPSAEL